MLKCECGREFAKQGALNLHRSIHCKLKHNPPKPPEKKKRKPSGCEHAYRLLRSTSEIENKALAHGYTEVCEKCEELKQ